MFRSCVKLPNFDKNITDITIAKLATEGGYFTYKASGPGATIDGKKFISLTLDGENVACIQDENGKIL